MSLKHPFTLLEQIFFEYPQLTISYSDNLLYLIEAEKKIPLTDRPVHGFRIQDVTYDGKAAYHVYVQYIKTDFNHNL
jgi:hypothetical protein